MCYYTIIFGKCFHLLSKSFDIDTDEIQLWWWKCRIPSMNFIESCQPSAKQLNDLNLHLLHAIVPWVYGIRNITRLKKTMIYCAALNFINAYSLFKKMFFPALLSIIWPYQKFGTNVMVARIDVFMNNAHGPLPVAKV